MKFGYQSILFMLAILAVVAIAGCTSASNTGTAPTVGPAGATPTPLPAIGSTLNKTTMLDLSSVHWYKYQITPSGTAVDMGSGFTTAGSTMTEQWNFNVDHNGQKADEVAGTGNYPSNGGTSTTDVFLNHADHKQLLDGTMTVWKNGKSVYQGEVTPKLLAVQSLLDLTNSSYSGQHTVTYGGTETVIVPAGTYTATKYLYNGAYDLTVYVDPSVPVPVEIRAATTAGTIYDVKLMGWG